MKYEYDLICIGLGPAGMAVSVMGSEMGLKVAAVEKHKIGGECMNCGCIPSKALLRMAQFRHQVGELAKMQLTPRELPEPQKLFEKIQKDLTFINEKKTMHMFDKVNLFLGQGEASFIDAHTVQVGEHRLTAKRIFIAAGTRPALLPVPGLAEAKPLTNENLFHLEQVPDSLIVLGGGAIAVEMAQAFVRLGTKVTLLQRSSHILSKNDREAALVVEETLKKEGVELVTGDTAKSIIRENGVVRLETNAGKVLEASEILAASGREMSFASLKLENAGIRYSDKGIEVNKHLQTSAKHIYAIGDCNGYHLFSHAAMHQGMIALMNSMIPKPMRMNFKKFVVPSTVFSTPQISMVGLGEEDLKKMGKRFESIVVRYGDYGAAIAEEIPEGFVKVFTNPRGRIFGVVIVGEGSGEMINEWALAVQQKLRMHQIMFLQHSFPTMGFLSKRVAEQWMMKRMKSSLLKRMAAFFFRIMP
ncbi:MAG: NAD(P)/FAD-dependent oxidoreductase [Opitutales bacterium]|nr:NAD(P)/FAD-dependent oxidoreductase [Opitutales bacterium]